MPRHWLSLVFAAILVSLAITPAHADKPRKPLDTFEIPLKPSVEPKPSK